MKKILLLIVFIFLITGCKVEYNLVINNDLTVSESVVMSGTDEFFDSFYKSSRINVVKMFLDEGRRELLNNNGYQYEIIESDTPYVVANRNYNSLKKFADNTIFLEQYFESLEVIEQDGVVAIETKDFIPISPDSIERYGIKTTTIKIKSSYEVMEHNATSYDKKTNTYTWYIHDYTESFSLLFSYNPNKIYEPPKGSNDLLMILAAILLMVGLIIWAYFWNKKNK